MSLNLLIKTARKSTHSAFKHGTLVIKGGAIISTGYNHGERHSEVVALSKIWPSKRAGCTLVNIRVTKLGYSMSRPCLDCMEFLHASGVRKVVYSDRTGNFKEIRI